MKRRSKIGIVILSSFVFAGLSAGVGYAVWSVINIKNTITPTEQFYTVNFYNGSKLTKSLTGLEQDSFFSTPFLSDDAENHTYFTGWKEQNGAHLYKGSISLTLSSFTTIKDYTLDLYASFEKQVAFQVTTVLGETVQADSTYTVPVRISDPYLFPMFNLQLNIPENASFDNFQYDGKDITFYFMKREATQYTKTSGKVFNINDALYLGGDKCTVSELKTGGSFVLPIQAKFVSKSQTH